MTSHFCAGKLISLMLVFGLVVNAFGQNFKPNTFTYYIPENFQVLDSLAGDLNGDNIPDMILILKTNNEELLPESSRPLIILTGNKSGSFDLRARNDSVVLCKNCGGVFGDPYQNITIGDGSFSIEHYGGSSWRWSRSVTFKFDPGSKKFFLQMDSGISYHTSNPDSTETIVHNKDYFNKLTIENYSIYR